MQSQVEKNMTRARAGMPLHAARPAVEQRGRAVERAGRRRGPLVAVGPMPNGDPDELMLWGEPGGDKNKSPCK